MTLLNERFRLKATSATPSTPRVGQKSVVALRLTPVTGQFLISFLPPLSHACNAYYRVCFIGGNMLVSVFFFFFLSKFMKLVPFSTLLSYNCLLAYHVSGSINGFLAPCWHWYRCCDKALLLAPLTFLSALTLLSKFFFLLKPILRSFVR